MSVLRSRDNPRVRRWARLVEDPRFRRRERRVVVEGPHLVGAALDRGWKIIDVIATEAASGLAAKAGRTPVFVSESVFRCIVDSEAPQGVAAELELPGTAAHGAGSTVFLEGVQDAGNVGAILRSAAAFGVHAAVLDAGCADAWSAKALRAGAGAHFELAIRHVSGLEQEVAAFRGKLVCTLPRGGTAPGDANLSGTLGWIFGSEGRGVSAALQARASLKLSIPVALGTESLNVAAAAAICFYAAATSRPGAGS